MIITPRWNIDFINVLAQAATDVVTTPSYNTKVAINGLIDRHIRSGLWAGLRTYFNFRQDGAEAFGYYNLKDPTEKITKVGSTTFTPNVKVLFNNTSGYYNTNYFLSTAFANTACAIRSGLVDNSGQFVYGVNAASGLSYNTYDGLGVCMNSPVADIELPDTTIDPSHRVNRRVDASTIAFNRNGVSDGGATQVADVGTPGALTVYLGCRNNNGSANGLGMPSMSYWGVGPNTSDASEAINYANEIGFEAVL